MNTEHSDIAERDLEIERIKQDLTASLSLCDDLQARLQQQSQTLRQQRESFSRELHDETAQYLTALSFGLKGMESHCPPKTPSGEALAHVQYLYRELADAVHRLSLRLRQESIEHLGLCPSLVRHLEQWSKLNNMDVSFESTGLLELFVPAEIELAVYRIVQEALTNIIRHAEADSVRVELHGNDGQARIIIDDDGRGFDVEEVMASTHRLGLAGMQERAALVNGRLEINSEPGQGTNIILQVPLANTSAGK